MIWRFGLQIRAVPGLFALFGFTGCALAPSPATTISAAIAGVQSDLTAAHVVSTSHAGDWDLAQVARFDANVLALQCSQETSDPVVAMIAGPVTMSLTGSFSQSGSFSVSSLTTMPVFGIGADASRTRGQGLSLPVQFVPLASLPDAEMAREVEYAGTLLSQNDEVRHAMGARIDADRAALASRVELLLQDYGLASCPKHGEIAPFVGAERR
ncbi:hypothetical protein AA101099_1752 [Neoasaia chiangmaiensis NBRC 101099]|uniref:Uncharacterized protein n=1 Tax=Neoasaia chiangmaiensis TaxID=320497 RepID=A0A1U9KR59_9PROT|nr:hypothetical protein [Neoasaia chiangmaiensis]AQS88293.1 hypothetical protein A0U93_10435 [Neoasaia chiangmaiensis]GBR39631.1 hypothetical protein AA101099_1752 [Neoasaia chiangmaiensis NBRC 101099]GEN14673.1 hypothetical protein NCH01_11040 [Neoasaia chiangmaiensis]